MGARNQRRKVLASRWIVVLTYADEESTTDVAGCSSYAQAQALVSAALLHISEGGLYSVSLLDADRRVLFDSHKDPRGFEVWGDIPSPGHYRFDFGAGRLVSMPA